MSIPIPDDLYLAGQVFRCQFSLAGLEKRAPHTLHGPTQSYTSPHVSKCVSWQHVLRKPRLL